MLTITNWYVTAKAAMIPCVMIGWLAHTTRNEDVKHIFLQIDADKQRHQLCAYKQGYALPKASNLAYFTWSSIAFAAPECRCPANTPHTLDLPKRGTQHSFATRYTVEMTVFQAILVQCLSRLNFPTINFPTETKMREKERDKKSKEATGAKVERVKKRKEVEDHHDDMGDDVSSIMIDEDHLAAEEPVHHATQGLAELTLRGFADDRPHETSIKCDSLNLFMQRLSQHDPGYHLMEIQGDINRQLTLLNRLVTGNNAIDFTMPINLRSEDERITLLDHVAENCVLITLLPPTRFVEILNYYGELINAITAKENYFFLHFASPNGQIPTTWLAEPAQFVTMHVPSEDRSMGIATNAPEEFCEAFATRQPRLGAAWDWDFKQRLVRGIELLLRRVDPVNPVTYFHLDLPAADSICYPTTSTGSGPGDPGREPPPPTYCKGCRWNLAKGRKEHTRVPGVCRFADVPEEEAWECPGCSRDPMRPSNHPDHTLEVGKCRWADIAPTAGSRTARQPRTGQHPRSASIPARSSPTAGADGPTMNPDTDTVPDIPNIAPPPSPHPVPRTEGSSSSSSSGHGRKNTHGGDGPTSRDRASGDAPNDWSNFDVTKSLRTLRSANNSVVEREIRKLHIRWWHANRASMEAIFKSANLPQTVIDLVPDVINTCRECRRWALPGNRPVPAIAMALKQNEQVEADVLYYRRLRIWHMVDRADRWHAALIVPDLTKETLQSAVFTTWVQIFGPFQLLIIDGESAINCPDTIAALKRQGILVRTRAPEQHAHMIERRGAILRKTLHLTEDQCVRENVAITPQQLVAEGVFAGNALISIGGASPYQARFGYTPRLLPDITNPTDRSVSSHRLREIALQKMIESTAVSRINRAARTATTPAAEQLDFRPGDQVEYYRRKDSGSKDETGWHGPASVIACHKDRGLCEIDTHKARQNNKILVRFADLRHHLDYLTMLRSDVFVGTAMNSAVVTIQRFYTDMPEKETFTFGFIKNAQESKSAWHLSKTSNDNQTMMLALEFYVRQTLHYTSVTTIRIAKGTRRLWGSTIYNFSVLLWWRASLQHVHSFTCDHGRALTTPAIVGAEWEKYNYMQLLFKPDAGIELHDVLDPSSGFRASSGGRSNPGAELAPPASPSHEEIASHGPSTPSRLSTIQEGDEDE